jgi:hypothetical protein
MQMKKSLEIGLACVAFVTVVYMLGPPIFSPHHERNSAEIRALFDRLELGMTKKAVRQAMDSQKYPHLEFHHGDGQLWSVNPPHEGLFGDAEAWLLIIEFQGDYVSMVRIRKADGDQDYHHPTDAPLDKGRRSSEPD